MIKTLTFVIVMVLSTANLVNAYVTRPNTAFIDSIQTESKSDLPSDTIFTPASSENPLLSYQNLIYKQRLDSIQKIVPLSYNEHVQGYIDIYIQRKEQIGKMLGLSKYYFPIFERALQEAGLPDEIKFLTVIESALNPHAVSRSGAVGPWQFMYTTAKGYGLQMDSYVDERKDPVKASYAAARYFLDAYQRIGDWLLTIAAFNCGTGAVTRAIARSGGVADFWKVRSFLPRETQNYVPAFIATVYAMNYYQNHDIELKPADFSVSTDIIPVNRRVSISSIAKAADLSVKELLILNPSYKKQIVNGSAESPKTLIIPGIENGLYASLYDVLNGNKSSIVSSSVAKLSPKDKPVSSEYYKVKTGQDLIAIADEHDVEVQDLKVWNKMKTGTVVPGQNIRLSAPKASSEASESRYLNYIVKVGDTLSEIAEKFTGATVSKIKALNGLTRSAISPGMRLKINRL